MTAWDVLLENEDGTDDEVIDTVIPPQSWGKQKDKVTLTAWY